MPPSFFFVSQFDARRSRRRPPENPDSDAIVAPEEVLKEKEGDCPSSLDPLRLQPLFSKLLQEVQGGVSGGGRKGNKQLASILLTTEGRGRERGCLFGEVGRREGKGGSLG